MRFLAAAGLLLTAGLAFGHSDPLGEVRPRLTANKDGNFTVTFRYFDPGREGKMRMLVGADGKEVVPRHWIKRGAEDEEIGLYRNQSPNVRNVDVGSEGAKLRLLMMAPAKNDGAEKSKPVVLPVEHTGAFETMEAIGKQVALAFGGDEERTDDGVPFNLEWCRSDGFQPGRTVKLGTVACIYNFPSASRLVWNAGRWWIAWVEVRKKEDAITYTTVLSSVDQESGKVKHHDLPGISNWNTSLDIAVNAAGTFCVAWHASLDGSYPGTAKIVTAVFTPEK